MWSTPYSGYSTIKDVDEEIIEDGFVELVELITPERLQQIDFNVLDMDETLLLLKCALLKIKSPLIYDGNSRIKLDDNGWKIFNLIEEKVGEVEMHFKGPLNDAEIYVRLANLMAATGSNEKAEKYLNRAIEVNPKRGEAWFQLGLVLDRMGRFEEAIRCYDRATRHTPELPIAWVFWAKALEDLGKEEEALKALDKALELEPENPDIWLFKGNLLYNLGRFSEAKEAYEKGNYLKDISDRDKTSTTTEIMPQDTMVPISETDQNLIEIAEKTIARGKSLGVDVSEAETFLKQVRNNIEEGDYEKALENAKISIAEGDRAMRVKIQEAIDHVNQKISYAKVYVIVDEAEMYHNQSLDAFESGDYEKALELSGKALSSLNNTIALHKDATRTIQVSWGKISDAKSEGADTSVSERLLKEARESLKNGNYQRAREFAEQSVKQIVEPRAIMGKKVVEGLMKLKGRILEAEKKGLSVADLEKELEKADLLFEKEDFKAATEILQKVETELEEKQNEYLMSSTLDMTMVARAIIGELRGFEFAKLEDIKEIEDILDEVDIHFQGKNFVRANEVATKAQLKAQQLKAQYIKIQKGEIDEKIRDNVSLLKSIGRDASSIEEMKAESDKSFKAGNLEQGFEILKKAYSLSENLISELAADMDKLLEDLKERLENLAGLFRDANMQDELDTLKEKVITFNKDLDTKEAVGRFLRIVEQTDLNEKEARTTIISTQINEVKKEVDELAGYGVDVKDMYNHLKNAEMLAEDNEFDDAMETINRVRAMIGQRENLHRIRHISELIKHITEALDTLRKQGHDVSQYDKEFDNVRQKFRSKDYIEAQKAALDLNSEIESTMKKSLMDEASNSITQMKVRLEEVSEMKEEVSEVRKYLMEAEEEFTHGRYEEALEKSEKGHKLLDEIIQKRTALIRLQSVREMLKELKNSGVDITEAKKIFDLCRPLMEKGDYKSVIDLADRAEKAGKSAEKNVKEISKEIIDLLLDAQDLIINIKVKGGKTEAMEASLQEARSLYHRKEFEKSKELLKDIMKEGEKIKELRDIIVVLKGLRTEIDEVKEMGMDTTHVEKIFKKAEPAIKSKRFDIIKKIEVLVKEELSKIRTKMEVTEELDKSISHYQRLSSKGVKFSFGPDDINQIKVMLDKNMVEEAKNKMDSVKAELLSTEDKYNRVVEIISGSQLLMKEAKKRGLPVDHLDSKFRHIMGAMSNGEYSTAFGYAEEVEGELEKLLERGTDVQDMLSLARMKVKELMEMNISPAEIEAKIDIINMNLARGDIDRASESAEKLLEDIERLKNKYRDLQSRSDKIKELIVKARQNGIDSARAQVYFDQSTLARNRGDLDRSDKFLDDIVSIMKEKGIDIESDLV